MTGVVDEAARPIAGRLRYAVPPEPGTILGPNWLGELVVALGPDAAGRTVLGYATVAEVQAAAAAARDGGPRSEAERTRLTGRATLVRRPAATNADPAS